MLAVRARRCLSPQTDPMANVVVKRLAAFIEGSYGNLPVAVDELPSHVTADAREAAVHGDVLGAWVRESIGRLVGSARAPQ